MKRSIAILIVISLIILLLYYPPESQSQQDPPHYLCCVWIYIAGYHLGVSNSMSQYSALSDQFIIQHLFRASDAVEIANTLCNRMIQAWSKWYSMQKQLDALCNMLAENPGPKARKEIFKFTGRTRIGWAAPLRQQEVQTPLAEDTRNLMTCSNYYFTIGFDTGFAHNAFQVAQEGGPKANAVIEKAQKHMLWVKSAIDGLNSLKTIRPWSGYCVNLWRVPPIMDNLRRILYKPPARPSVSELETLVGSVKSNIEAVLQNGYPPTNVARCPGIPATRTDKGRRFGINRTLRDPRILQNFLNKLRRNQTTYQKFNPDLIIGIWRGNELNNTSKFIKKKINTYEAYVVDPAGATRYSFKPGELIIRNLVYKGNKRYTGELRWKTISRGSISESWIVFSIEFKNENIFIGNRVRHIRVN